MIDDVIKNYGKVITKTQFEEIYKSCHPYFIEKYGKPKRTYTSVFSFGQDTRKELKDILTNKGISIVDDESLHNFSLEKSSMDRLNEFLRKIKNKR